MYREIFILHSLHTEELESTHVQKIRIVDVIGIRSISTLSPSPLVPNPSNHSHQVASIAGDVLVIMGGTDIDERVSYEHQWWPWCSVSLSPFLSNMRRTVKKMGSNYFSG